MKILHVTDPYGDGGGGAALTVDSLCCLLEAAGHANSVLYGSPTGALPNRPSCYVKGIAQHQLWPDHPALKQANAFVEREAPDLIQFHHCENFFLLEKLLGRYPAVFYIYNHAFTCPSGTRYYSKSGEICPVSTGPVCLVNRYTRRCGSRHPGQVFQSSLRARQLKQLSPHVSKFVVISNYVRQTMLAAGYPTEKITVIPSLSPLLLQDFETEAAPPTNPATLLFVGRITRIKGLEFLLRGLPRLKNPWKLRVVGEGYNLPQVRQVVAELGLQDRVEFNGWLPNQEMAALYREAAIVVVPSLYPDPLVLVGLEAMCYARPVVAFRVGGIPDWLEDGYNGFLAQPGQLDELIQRIDRLLSDPMLARQMGANGKQKLLAEFAPSRITADFLKCYDEVLRVSPLIPQTFR